MAGHSHWAQIKRKKAVVDARRGKQFAKLIRGVEVAAREAGTSDPDNNMTLAAAWERARQNSLPLDTIQRAAKRGAGELEGITYERIEYEGYGPGGVAMLVETLTDNRNRTGQEIRMIFSRRGGNLGEPGSVAWMFARKGIVIVAGHHHEDEVLAAATEGSADDVTHHGDRWELICDMKDFAVLRDAVASAGLEVLSADLTMLPTTTVALDADGARPILGLMDALEDNDDVQNVYTNFDVPEEVLAALTS